MLKNLRETIDAIMLHIRKGNEMTAGLALATLRRSYEATKEIPEDEWPWRAFATKYFPELGYERVQALIGRVVHRGGILRCSKCEAEAVCQCGCGVAYLPQNQWAATDLGGRPTAFERAVSSIKADPTKSNRAIAKAIGVSFETVARARKKLRQETVKCVTDELAGKVPSSP